VNYGALRTCDVANGDGVRVSLFVSGCTHKCKGCFNEEAQDFSYGKPFTEDTENEILQALTPSYVQGLTILGGEPMESLNQASVLKLCRRVREKFGTAKTIWIYTGCVLEKDLLSPSEGGEINSRWRTDATAEILSLIDVLVDGPFVESLRNLTLKFRGSSNQRLIYLKENRIEQ
jgi:anaerobic ribonucleoside-triphosphate reductase activating protein